MLVKPPDLRVIKRIPTAGGHVLQILDTESRGQGAAMYKRFMNVLVLGVVDRETECHGKEVSIMKSLGSNRNSSNGYVAAQNQPRMSSTQDVSPLGSFRKLQPDIRWNIWRYLMPHLREPCPQSQEESEKLIVSGIFGSHQNRLSVLVPAVSLMKRHPRSYTVESYASVSVPIRIALRKMFLVQQLETL